MGSVKDAEDDISEEIELFYKEGEDKKNISIVEDEKLVLSEDISSQPKKTEPEEGKYFDSNGQELGLLKSMEHFKENLVETKGISQKDENGLHEDHEPANGMDDMKIQAGEDKKHSEGEEDEIMQKNFPRDSFGSSESVNELIQNVENLTHNEEEQQTKEIEQSYKADKNLESV